jgi:hypothetical protein
MPVTHGCPIWLIFSCLAVIHGLVQPSDEGALLYANQADCLKLKQRLTGSAKALIGGSWLGRAARCFIGRSEAKRWGG